MDEPESGIEPPESAAGPLAVEDEDETIIEDAIADAGATAAPEVLAQSLSEYLDAWWRRIRSGESGAVPILVGMVLIVIFFQVEESSFLTAGNIVNLLVQAASYILFGAAEIFALLLSEIDLSVGWVAAVGAFAIAELIAPPVNLVWWLAILGGLTATTAIGLLQGSLITRLHSPRSSSRSAGCSRGREW